MKIIAFCVTWIVHLMYAYIFFPFHFPILLFDTKQKINKLHCFEDKKQNKNVDSFLFWYFVFIIL